MSREAAFYEVVPPLTRRFLLIIVLLAPLVTGPGTVPSNNDKDNFTLLLKEFRSELDKVEQSSNEHHPLTIAVAATGIENSYDVPEIVKHLDFINIMTYDFHGSWDAVTDHNAPFENGSKDGWSFTER